MLEATVVCDLLTWSPAGVTRSCGSEARRPAQKDLGAATTSGNRGRSRVCRILCVYTERALEAGAHCGVRPKAKTPLRCPASVWRVVEGLTWAARKLSSSLFCCW